MNIPAVAELKAATAATEEALYAQVCTGPCDPPNPNWRLRYDHHTWNHRSAAQAGRPL